MEAVDVEAIRTCHATSFAIGFEASVRCVVQIVAGKNSILQFREFGSREEVDVRAKQNARRFRESCPNRV